jgi:putative transcriptional regulator
MNDPRFLVGQLLLAMPGIGDPRFEQAVIAMCAHDEEGALGIGIGAVLDGVSLHGLLAQLGIEAGAAPDVPVHYGGPVEPSRGFVLHSLDWAGEGTTQAADKWALTGTLDVLKAIAGGQGPSQWLVALGYAGWGEGQLDEEMLRHGWHIAPAGDGFIYSGKADTRWARAFRASGIDPRLLSNASGHA